MSTWSGCPSSDADRPPAHSGCLTSFGPEHVPHVVEQAGRRPHGGTLTFVDQIGETMRLRFLLEFATGVLALFIEQLGDALPEGCSRSGSTKPLRRT